jgi:hypothetical protein
LNTSQCFPWFAKINYETNVGAVNYDGLQMNLSERASHGLTFSANYTFAHALGIQPGNGLGGGAALNTLNPKGDYGPISFDVRNHFSLTFSYTIPGRKFPGQMLEGWAINSSVDHLSKLPLNALDSSFDTSEPAKRSIAGACMGPPHHLTSCSAAPDGRVLWPLDQQARDGERFALRHGRQRNRHQRAALLRRELPSRLRGRGNGGEHIERRTVESVV